MRSYKTKDNVGDQDYYLFNVLNDYFRIVILLDVVKYSSKVKVPWNKYRDLRRLALYEINKNGGLAI